MIDTAASPACRTALSATLIVAVIISLVVAPGLDGLFGGLLACIMLAITVADSRRFLIPNELTAAAGAIGLLRAGLVGEDPGVRAAVHATLGAVTVTLPFLALMVGYRALRGREGLGFGDVKLGAVAGIWLGWITIFTVIELATLAALGAYLIAALIRKRRLTASAVLPFGAFLAPAIWLGWLAESWLR